MLSAKIFRRIGSIGTLGRNACWTLSIEIVAKFSRIITVVALATYLSLESYGIAMLALVCHELLSQVLRAGIGPQVIQCSAKKLPELARSGLAYQLIITGIVFIAQCTAAYGIAYYYEEPKLVELLQWLALTYLFLPFVSINIFLLQRANQMKHFSLCNGVCITIENVATALLVFYGSGIMSVVYGKLLFSFMWFVLFVRAPVSFYGICFNCKIMMQIFQVSKALLATELLKTLRLNADIIIAGKILPADLFGLYTFAKNAGIGVSQSLTNAYNTALFPYLCEQRNKQQALSLPYVYTMSVLVSGLFLLQSALVPLYLPLIFPPQWHGMEIPIIVLCLSAIPLVIFETRCSIIRSHGAFTTEAVIRLCVALATFITLLLLSLASPLQFAISVLVINTSLLLTLLPHKSIVYHGQRLKIFLHKAGNKL